LLTTQHAAHATVVQAAEKEGLSGRRRSMSDPDELLQNYKAKIENNRGKSDKVTHDPGHELCLFDSQHPQCVRVHTHTQKAPLHTRMAHTFTACAHIIRSL
jgi:hypothetical protein